MKENMSKEHALNAILLVYFSKKTLGQIQLSYNHKRDQLNLFFRPRPDNGFFSFIIKAMIWIPYFFVSYSLNDINIG